MYFYITKILEMKHIVLMSFFILLYSHLFAVKGYIANCQFNDSDNNPYIETYISIPYESITFIKSNHNLYYGSIEVTILYKDTLNNILYYEKVSLKTEEVTDTFNNKKSLIDVFRKSLAAGVYIIDVKLDDENNADDLAVYIGERISVLAIHDKPIISDIQLLDRTEQTIKANRFTKGALDLIPYCVNFYPTEIKSLRFYLEIYNTLTYPNMNEFLVQFTLRDHDNFSMVNNLHGKQRCKASTIVPLLAEMSLTEVPNGPYDLYIEVLDRNLQFITSKKILLYRINDEAISNLMTRDITTENFTKYISDKDITNVLKSHLPIADDVETTQIDNLLKSNDTSKYRIFIFNFWYRKDPVKTMASYSEHIRRVNVADKLYSCGKYKGYTTDRGRVLIKNGEPNFMVDRTFSGQLMPYEIWKYNVLNGEFNVKFVFVGGDLQASCDYELVHSTSKYYTTGTDWMNALSINPMLIKTKSNAVESNNKSSDNTNVFDLFYQDYNP